MTGTSGLTGQSTKNTSTTNTYQWWDGAVQGTIAYSPDTGSGTTYNTTFNYDAFGQLLTANIADGRPRWVYYRTDGAGQIIRRDEADGVAYNTMSGAGGDPHEVWYRFNGHELGYTGNNASGDLRTASSIADRRVVTGSGAFRNGGTVGETYSDFAASFDPVNSYAQGSSAGSYTVQQSGESLRSVAQMLWGDASLWYVLAEANGLQADVALTEGQRLAVPPGVMRTSHNATTLRPYDANEAIGNVSPTTPKPAKKNKCGAFGQLLLVAVAIAVTMILKVPIATALNGGTAAAAGSAAAIGGAALAGAAGSVAGQGLGVATGIQDKFSFKGVALSAIGAGVGAGVGELLPGAIGGSPFLGDLARGALGSAVTQAIGVATGLQDRFSWVGVAASAVGNAAGGGVARELARDGAPLGISAVEGGIKSDAISTGVSTLANAATRSALEGSNFGDNLLLALPDALGGVIGRALGGAANVALAKAAAERAERNPVASGGVTVGGRLIATTVGSDIKGTNVGYRSPYANFGLSYSAPETAHFGEGLLGAIKEYAPGLYDFGARVFEGAGQTYDDIREIIVEGSRAAFDNVLDFTIRYGNAVEQGRAAEASMNQETGRIAYRSVASPVAKFAFGAATRPHWRNHYLGSRLNQSQNASAVTSATPDRKLAASLS